MDKITANLLTAFAGSHGLEQANDSDVFEHFCSYAVLSTFLPDSFETGDIVVGG